MMDDQKLKLRWPLDLHIEKFDQQELLIIACPQGLLSQPLVLNAAVAPVIQSLDGNLSFKEILNKFKTQGLSLELLKEIVEVLDQNYCLDNQRYHTRRLNEIEEFSNNDVRRPALAGRAYAKDLKGLTQELESYLALSDVGEYSKKQMVGLIAPHIDYRRGKECYGRVYRSLANQNHDLVLLLGTSHQYSRKLFHLCDKDFDTPIAALKRDSRFIQELARLYGVDRSFKDQILHKQEHSLELQTPFLALLAPQAKIVPVLIGSFHKFIEEQRYPEEYPEYQEFVEAFATLLKERIKYSRINILSGVDMAHVGRAFGDPGALSPQFMGEIAERDQIYLESVRSLNKKALFEHIAEDQDARKICGYPTLYLMLDLIERLDLKCKVEVFDYRQAVDYQTDCAVTFAGLAMYV